MNIFLRVKVAAFGLYLVIVLGFPSIAEAQGTVASANIGEVGHSLVNTTMPAMLVPVAQSLQKQIQMTVQIINGAPLSWQWNNHTQAQQSTGNPAFTDLYNALPTLRPDVVVLTERVDIAATIQWENTNGYVGMWVARARAANPNVRPYLYTTWYGYNSSWYPGMTTRPLWRARIESDGLLYEQVARAAGIQIVPGHRAMMALYDAIAAGQVPGYSSIDPFFVDDIHLNGMGNYYIALVHYATIYKASPVGAAIPPGAGVSAALAQQLQQMAWSVVSGYSLSGVTGGASPTAGTCGTSNGKAFASAPTTNLCTAGTASAVTGTGPYAWTCAGTNGGATASCSATRTATATNGACGVANGVAIRTAPSSGLCAAGTPSSVMGAGPFAWSCAGLNGGTTAGCSAPLLASVVNGSCGSSNGGTFATAPSANLCVAGTATAVAGSGPFTWSCRGVNGGTTAACRANQQTRTVNSIGTLGRGGSRVYSFNVPTGATTASFVLTGTSGNADLYVSRGSRKTRAAADWRSLGTTSNEQIALSSPTSGTYYVEVYGVARATGLTLTTTISR